MKHVLAALLTLVWLLSGQLASPVYAGVAIVQAPEQSGGICANANASAAFECARKKCVTSGVSKNDCLDTAYCRNGWTVDVFLQGQEGNHWHEYYCGWNDRKTALKAGKLVCNAERMKALLECAAVQVIDNKGKAFDVTGVQ